MIREANKHTFESILGHEMSIKLLKKMIDKKRMPNTFLFAGHRGVGKKSLAFAFIKRLNCLSSEAVSGCQCVNCRKTSEMKSTDITQIFPTGAINQIAIEDIRNFHDIASIYPVEYKRKILFIHDADRLNIAAANALLKLLEEPPEHLITILFCENPSIILPTIRSRCMPIRLSPIPANTIARWLKKEGAMGEKEAELAAYFSEGMPGKALEIADGSVVKKRKTLYGHLDFLMENGFSSIPAAAFRIQDSEIELEEALKLMLIWFRDVLMLKIFKDDIDKNKARFEALLLNRDMIDKASEYAGKLPIGAVFSMMKSIGEYAPLTKRIVNNDLLLRVLLSEIETAANA